MCEKQSKKLRGRLQRGTARVVSKISKEASLSSNEFELLIYTLLLKKSEIGIEVVAVAWRGYPFFQKSAAAARKVCEHHQ